MKNIKNMAVLCTIIFFGCNTSDNQTPKTNELLVEGDWHLEFHISPTISVPVDFILKKNESNAYIIQFTNADEVVVMNPIEITENNIQFRDKIFNTWFDGQILSPTEIKGKCFREDKENAIPFTATQEVRPRFPEPKKTSKAQPNISGTWEVDFSKGTPEHYKAIGQFHQVDNYVSGTFMTETGDYRFLEGNMYNNNLFLSCFDGSHIFLFKASFINDVLQGNFWSGLRWEEPWTAIKNEKFKLSNPDSLTYLKEGFSSIEFRLPNTNGDTISLTDKKYNGKVVIVNIMGPWCPNCKDETAHLTELYNQFNAKGLEVIALSFDKTDDFEQSKESIQKIQQYFHSKYDFLIAGKANKIEASKALPMLNQISAYPTTLFIDRKGNVRKIRTGFNGPGTGDQYKKYKADIEIFIQNLLSEK